MSDAAANFSIPLNSSDWKQSDAELIHVGGPLSLLHILFYHMQCAIYTHINITISCLTFISSLFLSFNYKHFLHYSRSTRCKLIFPKIKPKGKPLATQPKTIYIAVLLEQLKATYKIYCCSNWRRKSGPREVESRNKLDPILITISVGDTNPNSSSSLLIVAEITHL